MNRRTFFEVAEPVIGILTLALVVLTLMLAACSTSRPAETVPTDAPVQYREAVGAPAAVPAAGSAPAGASTHAAADSPTTAPAGGLADAASDAPAGQWRLARPDDAADRGQWWRVYGDSRLDALIASATQANTGLAVAVARVKQARATAGLADADRAFTVGAGIGPTRQGGFGTPDFTQWRSQLSFSYEVDLFGRLSDASRAGQLDADAQAAAYASVLLALQADVAQQYFALRSLDAELQVLDRTIALREEALLLTRHRYEAGDTSELDVAQARTELATTQAEAQSVRRRRAQHDHALAVLLGQAPAQFSLPQEPLAVAIVEVPPGLPSELLQRRPDIAQAQRTLAAASARIGAAKAAFFPSLVLTGSGGYASDQLKDLFKWSSRSWLLGPYLGTALNVPLLDGGRNKANLAFANAAYESEVASYRQSVLVGFQDVEDSLSALHTLDRQAQYQDEAVAAARLAAHLAQSRYRNGAASYFEVIDAQRSSLAAERAQSQILGQRAGASVSLIRALGGAWVVHS
jgi:multidrug efflux system outer membrane protein